MAILLYKKKYEKKTHPRTGIAIPLAEGWVEKSTI